MLDLPAESTTEVAEIAYIMKGYPRLSETFIANEIHLLETMGMRLRLYSVKRGDAVVHGVVGRIKAPLTYLPATTSLSGSSLLGWLSVNLPQFAAAHWRVLARRPTAYLQTLATALAMAWQYRREITRPRKVFIKEFLQAGYIAAQVLDAPAIRHLHGHFCHGATTITWFASRLTGLPFSFTAHAKDIYQEELNPGDLLKRKLNAAEFVATCTGANHAHLSSLDPQCKVVHTIYHGLDTDYFVPPQRQAGQALPLVLAVGRFVEKKGFAYLVEACVKLKASGLRFRCLLVGEKDQALERICALIADSDLADTVSLRNAVTQEELRGIYREAAIFALPCQVMEDGDRDGIPNVLAEAMAMGIPIVSTAISGIPELVDDGVDGLLVPQRNSAALAAALARLLSDPGLRTRLGAAGRAKVCEVFDSKKTTIQLKELFVSAIQSKGLPA